MQLNAFSPVWVLLSWKLWVLSCFSKAPDPENLLAHFEQKKCFSLVWFSHFSSIHLILRSSWQTLCIYSFSTVGVILLLFHSFIWWREAIVTFGALECFLSCVSPLIKLHQLVIFLCFFKSTDTERLLSHFLHCFSPVSSIHLISRRLCAAIVSLL